MKKKNNYVHFILNVLSGTHYTHWCVYDFYAPGKIRIPLLSPIYPGTVVCPYFEITLISLYPNIVSEYLLPIYAYSKQIQYNL